MKTIPNILAEADTTISDIKAKTTQAQKALMSRQYDVVRRLLGEIKDKL